MAQEPRRSRRQIKSRQESDFVYDAELTEFLSPIVTDTGEVRHHRTNTETEDPRSLSSAAKNSGYTAITTSISWVNIHELPDDINLVPESEENLDQFPAVFSDASHSQTPNESECEVTSHNNNIGREGDRRSSTRVDFLDLEENFLSVSSSVVRIETSEMSGDNSTPKVGGAAACKCSRDNSCSVCCSASASKSQSETSLMLQAMTEALNKIDKLANEVASIKRSNNNINSRLDRLEERSGTSNIDESSQVESSHGVKKLSKAAKVDGKKSRVEDEKERQFNLLQEKLRDRGKEGESQGDEYTSANDSFNLNLQILKKKMTQKQNQSCKVKVASRLKQVGATFPEEDSTSGITGASGTESELGTRLKSRHKVKSGSKISKRAVVQTELWPHTIANEDDGDEVNSDNISLAKFLSCFSYIMVNCGKEEASGRGLLLHAVSLVLECLPWADARNFHNLVMLKIEQGRIDWVTDFAGMAENFLDKKVRLNLRSRGSAVGQSSWRSPYSKSAGKGFRSEFRSSGNSPSYNNDRYSSYSANRNKSLIAFVCRQWNAGTCSYGERCKRWHACLSCAEAGRMGEPHKASSHGSSTGRGRQDEPRV